MMELEALQAVWPQLRALRASLIALSPQVAQYGRVVRRRALQQRLFKTGGRLIRHARYFILQLAESHLTPTLFRQILGRIERLAWHPT